MPNATANTLTAADVHDIRALVGMAPVTDAGAQAIADRINATDDGGVRAAPDHDQRAMAEQLARLVEVDGRYVGEYVQGVHDRHTTDMIVGYVVRETIGTADQGILWRFDLAEGGCGYDAAVVDDPCRYADAVGISYAYHDAGRHAIVDNLYNCGCRGVA